MAGTVVTERAFELLTTLGKQGITLAVAESLTGGALSSALVDVPGASRSFVGGAVTYATASKNHVLGVDPRLLKAHGPVHPEVAVQMAAGVARLFEADCAIATTGVAGPGDNPDGPAGRVFVAFVRGEASAVRALNLAGGRHDVRVGAVLNALQLAQDVLAPEPS